MSVGFGFSAGDFIAAIGLVANVTTALKDAGGASDEYRSLVRELESLKLVVKTLHDRQGAEGVFPADITQQTDITLVTLSDFLQTISRFDEKLGPQAASGWHHGVGRKAQWAVVYAKEVEKLRVKLGTQLSKLNMLLQLYASARFVRLIFDMGSESFHLVTGLTLDQGRSTCNNVGQRSHGHTSTRQADGSLSTGNFD